MVKRRLRIFVISLVAASFVPVGFALFWTSRQDWIQSSTTVENEMERLLYLVKQNREANLRAVRTLLIALADSEAVRERDEAACHQLLWEVASKNRAYANIGSLDLEGNVLCSAYPVPKGTNFSTRKTFQKSVATGLFAAGEYDEKAVEGKRTVIFTQPVFDEKKVIGVIFLAADLMQAAELVDPNISPPLGGDLAIINHEGRFYFRLPDAEAWIGKKSDFLRFVDQLEEKEEESFSEVNDGKEVAYFVREIPVTGGPDLHIVASIDWEKVWIPFRRTLLFKLFFLGSIATLGVAAAWMVGRIFILKPSQYILKVLEANRRGDFSMKAADVAEGGEFRVIGEAFDQMTEVLGRRIQELRTAQSALERAHAELEERVERRTADLRLAQERLRDAIENLDAGFAMFDAEGNLVVCNRAFAEIYGAGAKELLHPGVSARVLIDYYVTKKGMVNGEPATQEWAERRYQEIMAADGSVEEELIDDRWIRTSVKRTHDGGAVGLRTDVTDIRNAEAEIRRKAEALRRSNKELEQFAYVASHDLQEPLRMVASYTQLLARRYSDQLDSDAKEFIQYAINGVKKMQAFIKDLLKFSRVETHGQPFEKVDLNKVVGEVMETFHYLKAEAGAEVDVGKLPTISGDPFQLSQLFQNLIANSFKFRSERPLKITVRANKGETEGEWVLSVEDNGIGFDEANAERIFEIFHRLNPQDNLTGTGIGLGIAKRIVERHGGRIWVKAREGEGATFFFTLYESHEAPPVN